MPGAGGPDTICCRWYGKRCAADPPGRPELDFLTMASSKPTLNHVAREAGVSVSTAWRALRATSPVRHDLADRVRKAALRVGYGPKPKQKRPTSRRPGRAARERKVVVLVPGNGSNRWPVEEILEGVLLTLKGAGVEAATSDAPPEQWAGAVDGTVAVGVADAAALRALSRGCRVVSASCVVRGIDCVAPDEFGGAYRLASEALALGHRRVAVMTGPERHPSAEMKRRGVAAAMENAGLSKEKVFWAEAGPDADSGARAADRVLNGRPVTLFICSGDAQAVGVCRAATGRGLGVPKEVSVTGFGGIRGGGGPSARLTTVSFDPYAVGMVAAERLLELMGARSGPPRVVLLPVEFVPGETLAPPPSG